MDTSAAATQAHVTAATIRTWCRAGVIAATKTAGRWIIDAASLAARIAIGAMKRPARPEAHTMLDLTATYAAPVTPGEAPVTITPTVKRRQTPHAGNIIKISGIIPLLADKIDSIPDAGDRGHALNILRSAVIVISDRYDADWDGDPQAREGGQLRTTYRGDIPQITLTHVLDLADQLRTQLAA
ncbi:MAG TPA: helix-turn-helix domain-containing protein [Streptomyces sp.]|nr:helix-turn-helix domain-containing protein [Streptomyces sp.]